MKSSFLPFLMLAESLVCSSDIGTVYLTTQNELLIERTNKRGEDYVFDKI